ncbi:MerR family transcriptional regulator [Microaceticoccus formicicus]|uniref:MerR family transcriptional regulator n=1 Tax=Microaceticoccus formicicus TaxID=3118105 RepID=UPI003CD019F7|nr:MerR family transcriptional regulator [Peptoniphilaceae bacterium AMB_02]
MLINEISKKTGLTKKAIDYYTNKGLLEPKVLENGYREYSEKDLENLGRISVLRKLSIGIDEIKLILSNDNPDILSSIAKRRDMDIKREKAKKELLDDLCLNQNYEEIEAKLMGIERGYSIRERLLEAFPGYFGVLIMYNFSKYLDTAIETVKQEKAYKRIIEFLDNCPNLELPEDLKAYLEEQTSSITEEMIMETINGKEEAVQNPNKFFKENAESIEFWNEYKNSDEYKNSPMYRLMEYLNGFYQSAGFVEEFVPALRELSPEYEKYHEQLLKANEWYIENYKQN